MFEGLCGQPYGVSKVLGIRCLSLSERVVV